MIQRVYESAKHAKLLSRVIVATDHNAITERVKSFGGEVLMTPESIRSGSDRIAYAAQRLPDADIVVNIQGDEPLIAPQMIDEAIAPLLHDASIETGTLVRKIDSSGDVTNPNIVKVVLDDDGYAIYFSRSPIPYLRDGSTMNEWHLHHSYYKHIGLYVFRRDFLLMYASWKESALEQVEKLEQLRILAHGHKIKAAVTSYDSIPIDTAEDAEKVRQILSQQSRVHTS
jgi:3-deoxy-manno-octulosonate cytidylyltransferase (CMP-KDO synthetase)